MVGRRIGAPHVIHVHMRPGSDRISANQGNGPIFTVFAAAVIGGISLDGGKGTMFGALTVVRLLGVVGNLLTLAQVPSFWIQAIYGAIILGSLMMAGFAGGQSQV
jgi:simple sugar transport system permease protein